MHWKLKCLAFHTFGLMPGGAAAYAWAQRHITGSYFTTLTDERLALYSQHVEHYRGSPGVALEFGAGGDLLAPLLISAEGAPEIFAYDIAPLATVERVNHIIGQLRGRVPGDWPMLRALDDLYWLYRIHYLSPADVRRTDLPDKSVDFVWSTSTFEHIPAGEIQPILEECRRICRGRMSFVIDYHDHYPGVSCTHFYRYSHREWRWLNPAWHHQNRLRHGDFADTFASLGLTSIVDERSRRAPRTQLGPVCADFCSYPLDDLLTMQGTFVLSCADTRTSTS